MIKNYLNTSFLTGILLFSSLGETSAQTAGFGTNEYKKALWMTTRMYGGQRSGDKNTNAANWLLIGHPQAQDGRTFLKDSDGSYDLSGGWFDCGDHVKFGHTEYYSAYMLLKGYAEFPKGYDDRYDATYSGYRSANNYTFEGNGHKGNNIPDVLDEVKHATDYIIKCARDANTFYYQVGDGVADHKQWVTSARMQNNGVSDGGEVRIVHKNPSDGAMPALAGAALALMARIYKPYDNAYAEKCLTHAKYAYAYAKAHKGQSVGAPGGFYGKNSNPNDAYAALLGELYWATKDESYKTEALAMTLAVSGTADVKGTTWGLDYVNNGDLGAYNLYLLGKPGADKIFEEIVLTHYLKQVNTIGLFTGGNATWGPLRYNASAAFVVALWANRNTPTDAMKKFIYSNIDYIMGKNSKNLSFIVGYGSNYAKQPHHRNVFMSDNNNMNKLSIPSKNQPHGYMVGGKRDPNAYQDNIKDYSNTEGGIDYSAGLVNALGYINSQLSPITKDFPAVELIPSPMLAGLISEEKTSSWSVYPNPSANTFEINAVANTLIKVYDQLGNEVASFNTTERTIFGEDLMPGFYHVRFYKGQNGVKSINVVKQ